MAKNWLQEAWGWRLATYRLKTDFKGLGAVGWTGFKGLGAVGWQPTGLRTGFKGGDGATDGELGASRGLGL